MKPVIRLEHIEKVFTDGKEDFEALRDVSLEVNEGDIFGIIGLSGAGKSTLVRCLNLLERPTSGKVYVNDKDMMTLSEPEIRRCRQKIGMVFQHFNLLMRTQNITIVVITHEMKVIQQICNRVAVLDEGRIQETGPVSEVFSHPQTRAAKRLVLARMQDADAPCVKLELPEDDKELAALMAYVKAHNLKVLEGEEHV